MNILFVSKGDESYLPIIKTLLKTKLEEVGLHDVKVDCAGTDHVLLKQALSISTINVSMNHGVDISCATVKEFNTSDFDLYDEIYTMDHIQFTTLMDMAPSDELFLKVYPIIYYINDDEEAISDFSLESVAQIEAVFQSLNCVTDRLLNTIQKNIKRQYIDSQNHMAVA